MQRTPGAYEFIRDARWADGRGRRQKQIPPLRYGMTNKGDDEGRRRRQKRIPPLRYGMTDEAGDTSGAGDEEDGDVVAAAVGVGGVDEGLAGGFERRAGIVHPSEQARWGPRVVYPSEQARWVPGSAGEDAGDGVVVEFAAEAVGGEQEEVAGIGGVGGDVGFDGRLRADGAGDDVADGRGSGLQAADEAGAELLLDQRVVLGEEVKRAAAKEVAAAVADVGEPERWAGRGGRGLRQQRGIFQEGSDESGAHAAQGARTLGAMEDRSIGGADGALEAGVGMIGRIRLAAVARGRGAGDG